MSFSHDLQIFTHDALLQSQPAASHKQLVKRKKKINLHFNVFYICIDDDNVYIVHLAHPFAMYSSV